MLAELSRVGEVVGRMVAALERLARLVMHVSQEHLQQVFLTGEMLVERPGSTVRGSRDVADLGVQVATLGELAQRRCLQCRLGLGRFGLPHSHCALLPLSGSPSAGSPPAGLATRPARRPRQTLRSSAVACRRRYGNRLDIMPASANTE